MKFTIGKRRFAQAVRTAHTFAKAARTLRGNHGGHDADPFRYPVALAASPLGLEIFAFDGKAILTQRLPAGVSTAGSMTLDTEALRGALDGAKARDIVTFEARSEPDNAAMAECRLIDGGNETALGRMWSGISDHHRAPLGERLEARLEIPAAELAAIVAETAFAASTELTRYYLNGIFIQSHDGRLRAVATDGHRLAIRDTDVPLADTALPEDGCGERGAILPLKPLRALQRLLKGGGPATVEIWTGGIRFRCRAGEIATEFLDGTFPDYRRVTPAGRMKSAPLDLAALAKAVKAARPGDRSAGRRSIVTLNGSVTMTWFPDPWRDHWEEYPEETLLPLECCVRGHPIRFKTCHLQDAGRAFGRVATVMRYTRPGHPAMFVSPDRPELVVVQMPSRV